VLDPFIGLDGQDAMALDEDGVLASQLEGT
jgi:hypothetical protein